MTATRHGIKRIFFGGYFIRGHPYTMDTISYAIRFWSKVRAAGGRGWRGWMWGRWGWGALWGCWRGLPWPSV